MSLNTGRVCVRPGSFCCSPIKTVLDLLLSLNLSQETITEDSCGRINTGNYMPLSKETYLGDGICLLSTNSVGSLLWRV